MSQKGRVAIVTGAARGIGAACARVFADEGCSLGLMDLLDDELQELVSELESRNVPVVSQAFDVANREKVFSFVQQVNDRFGRVDILVNNAGISPKKDGFKVPLKDLSWEEWQRVVNVNLHSLFHFTQAVAPGMIENRYGKIVNIASRAGRTYIEVPGIHYGVTKTAVIGLTRYTAGELREYGINANCITPGRIETPLMRQTAYADIQTEEKNYPAGFGSPEDVAATVQFLASDAARFINGAVVDINGGRTMV